MSISKQYLSQEYLINHFSAKEIATKLRVSENKVWYWITKYHIPIRSRSEANYLKYNPNGDPFSIKLPLSIEEEKLLYLALGLFWGEGNKRTTIGVRIGNSDPKLIQIWCKFLREVCQVQESKIKFYLQIFKDMNKDSAVIYWANNLQIHSSQINVAKPLHTLGKGSYKKISKYGVITVGVFNTHFLEWIMEQLYKLGYNPNL